MNYLCKSIMKLKSSKDYLREKFNLDKPEIVSVIDEIPLWSAPFGLKLLEIIMLKKNMNVLDIGFGLGFPMIEIAMRLGASSKVYGIDPWEAAIERAKFKIENCNVRNVEITKGVAEELPYEDNFFDLIVSNNGINNVEDMNKTFFECYRVSKKAAQLVFTMNLETTMIEFYNVYEEVLKKNGMPAEIEIMKKQIYNKRKPLHDIEAIITKSDFKINQIIHDNFYLRYADGTAMLNHFLIKIGFLEEWLKIIPHNKVEIIFDEIEKKLNKVADEIGEIKLYVPFVTIDCRK